MTATELLVVGIAVFTAAVIQIISGFGFALLAVPMMTLAIPTRDAVVVTTLLGMGVSSWQCVHGRADTDWRLVRRLAIAAYAGLSLIHI